MNSSLCNHFRFLRSVVPALLVLAVACGIRAQERQWEHFAGSNGGVGDRDAAGSAARFNGPMGAVVDAAGNTFVADQSNQTIRRVTPTGVVTTLAGQPGVSGTTDGPLLTATFFHPSGMARDAAGNLYVTDTNGYKIRRINFAGGVFTTVQTIAGTGAFGSADGDAQTVATFFAPLGIAVTPNGSHVFVADAGNGTIRRITMATGLVDTIAGTAGAFDSTDAPAGPGTAARFAEPNGLALVGNTLFVTDRVNNLIRSVFPLGAGADWNAASFGVDTRAGGPGLGPNHPDPDGNGTSARFYGPMGLAANPAGTTLMIVDSGTYLVRQMDIASNAVTTLTGGTTTPGLGENGSRDAAGSLARFNFNTSSYGHNGIAFNPTGTMSVVDGNNNTIRTITGNSVTTLAGRALVNGYPNQPFSTPLGMTVDNTGAVYVADSGNTCVWRIAGGVPAIIAGGVPGPGDPILFSPTDVAVDSNLKVYFTDVLNDRILVATGGGGFAVVADSANGISQPRGLAVDASDNIIVANTGDYTVLRITPGAPGVPPNPPIPTTVTRIAGIPGSFFPSTDGNALTTAILQYPADVAVDPLTGDIFIADNMNVRRLSVGTVTTFAGNGATGSVDGTGTAAGFSFVTGLAFDAAGNLYAADSGTTVRQITTPGAVVTTIGGRDTTDPNPIGGNQGGLGAQAMFLNPRGIAARPDGTLFLSTYYSHGVFIGTPPFTVPPVLVQPADGTLTRSPVTVEFTLPEPALPGSVKLSFGLQELTLTALHETVGTHSFTFDPATANVPNAHIASGVVIPDFTYTVTLTYRDSLGAPPASDSNILVTIDTTPPQTTITAAPSGTIGDRTPTVAFASSEAGSTFRVSLNTAVPFAAASPHTFPPLMDGPYEVRVWATDPAGNEDATPATASWTVAAVPGPRIVAATGLRAPGAAANYGTVFKVPALNARGRCMVEAALMDGREGIWDGVRRAMELRALTGEPLPGLPAGTSFNNSLSRAGTSAAGFGSLQSLLDGPGITSANNDSFWQTGPGGLELLVREGDAAPGTPAGVVVLSLPDLPALSTGGVHAFYAGLNGPGVITDTVGYNAQGLWLGKPGNLSLLARAGATAPGTGGLLFYAFASPSINGPEQCLFHAHLSNGTNPVGSGLWVGTAGSVQVLVLSGEAVPDLPGVSFIHFQEEAFVDPMPPLNAAGQTVFNAQIGGGGVTTDDDFGLWAGARGALWLVAREGDPALDATGAPRFAGFRRGEINAAGHVAFWAQVRTPGGTPAGNGVWRSEPGLLRPLAVTGQEVPGAPAGTLFSNMQPPALNDQDQVAFFASLSGPGVTSANDGSLWRADEDGDLTLIAREGDTLEVLAGDHRTISAIQFLHGSAGEDGRPCGLNDAGQVAFAVEFTDGTAAVSVTAATFLGHFDSWRYEYFLTVADEGSAADAADPDNDGITNAMERALGLDPLNPGALPITVVESGAVMEFHYTRSTAAAGETNFTVEYSDNLTGPWSTAGVTQTVLSDNGTTQSVRASVPASLARRFVRLTVSLID
jgi:sugar lactone lactonase YvrE